MTLFSLLTTSLLDVKGKSHGRLGLDGLWLGVCHLVLTQRGEGGRESPVFAADSHSFHQFSSQQPCKAGTINPHLTNEKSGFKQVVTHPKPHTADTSSGLGAGLLLSSHTVGRNWPGLKESQQTGGLKAAEGFRFQDALETAGWGSEGSQAPALAQRPVRGYRSGDRAHSSMALCFQS